MTRKVNVKRILYTICAYALCIIAYFRGAGTGSQWNAGLWCIGFVMLPIILCQYKLKDYLKVIYPYAIWLVVFAIGAFIYIPSHGPTTDYRLSYICQFMEIGVCGILIIRDLHTIISRGIKKTLGNVSIFTIAMFALFLLCTISVNESVWPLYFGVIFISLYLTPFSSEDMESLGLGIADALIIMFFVIQSHAFLYRPYDDPRYKGFFSNPNINAMFYFACYVGWMFKYYYLRIKHENKKKLITIVHFLFAASLWSFTLMTMCRTVLIGFFVVTLAFYIITEFFVLKTKAKGFLLRGFSMFIAFVISFPIVFACVRYIPPLRHHPIWIGDYSEEAVHSWDPIDSEKYVDIHEFIDALLGRATFNDEEKNREYYDKIMGNQSMIDDYNLMGQWIAGSVDVATTAYEQVMEALDVAEEQGGYLVAPGAGRMWMVRIANCKVDGIAITEYEDGVAPGTDMYHPKFLCDNGDIYSRILGIRKYIYWYYASDLNMLGHRPEYPSGFIFPDYDILHAHNTYLQFAYCYGIVAGVLLLVVNVAAVVYSIIMLVKKKDGRRAIYMFVMLCQMMMLFCSITENMAFPGKIILTLFFVSLLPLSKRKMINE